MSAEYVITRHHLAPQTGPWGSSLAQQRAAHTPAMAVVRSSQPSVGVPSPCHLKTLPRLLKPTSWEVQPAENPLI